MKWSELNKLRHFHASCRTFHEGCSRQNIRDKSNKMPFAVFLSTAAFNREYLLHPSKCVMCHSIRSCPPQKKTAQKKVSVYMAKSNHQQYNKTKTVWNNSYIIWVLLAGRAIAAGGAFEVGCDAVVVILDPEVGETIHWHPVEGDMKPWWSANSGCTKVRMKHRCVSSSPVCVNHPPDSKDGGDDGYQDDDSCSRTHQDQHQPLALGNTRNSCDIPKN